MGVCEDISSNQQCGPLVIVGSKEPLTTDAWVIKRDLSGSMSSGVVNYGDIINLTNSSVSTQLIYLRTCNLVSTGI